MGLTNAERQARYRERHRDAQGDAVVYPLPDLRLVVAAGVAKQLGMSRAGIADLIHRGRFLNPDALVSGRPAWRMERVDEWASQWESQKEADRQARSTAAREARRARSASVTSTQSAMYGRMGAYKVHAEGKTNTAPARAAFDARFEREVDPDGVLDPRERARRAEYARKAYFTRLGLKSATARRRRDAR